MTRPPEYRDRVELFARTGAELIQAPIGPRYRNLVQQNLNRPLEPGFIPPQREARITIVSYYPNASDLRGNVDYDALRDNFARWGRDATVESYEVAYRDWLASLPSIPFYRERTLPVLEGLGMSPETIAWLPLVKVPLPAGSVPDADIIEIDREDLWKQIQLLQPSVVWVQGFETQTWIDPLIRPRITDHVIAQSLAQRQSKAKARETIDGVVRKLARALSETADP